MARAPRSIHGQWRDAVWRCSRFLVVMISAGLLGSCGGGGGDDVNRTTPGSAQNTTGSGAGSGAGTGTALLTWNPVVDPNLAGYHIYFGTSTGAYSQPYGSGLNAAANVNTYSVTGLSNGTRYFFAATAYDAMGNESTFSNEVFKDIP